jgi:hypothetical protein
MADAVLPRTRAALRALAQQLRTALTGQGPPPPGMAPVAPEVAPRMLPGYHLPSVIRWGQTPASRLSKKGTWYLIIPFQHTSPGYGRPAQQMSSATYQQARQLAPGERLRPSGITRARYGSRTFLSFRTMTPTTRGWYVPPRPARGEPLPRATPASPEAPEAPGAQAMRELLAAVRADLATFFPRRR